jgi:hypothetical protein
MKTPVLGGLGLLLAIATVALAQPGRKVDIVSVTGCLRQQGPDLWMLVAATEPVPSVANAPPPAQIPKVPPAGTLRFRLIGVGEFNLPALKDRTVVVKGLFIKDTPVSRINLTSVVEAVPTCAAAVP